MTPAHQDIANRRPVWQALSHLFLDTELQDHDLIRIAETLALSPYSLADVETILYREVYPVCIGNLCCVAGEWAGFDDEWLAESILKHAPRSWAFRIFLQPRRWMIRGKWKRIKVFYSIFDANAAEQPLSGALLARRTIVVTFVPWSMDPRRAIALLESASDQLELLGITTAVVSEESAEVVDWIRLVAPQVPGGAGSLLWLKRGSVVDIEMVGGRLTTDQFLARTRNCLIGAPAD
jgi:hypothetical protein